MSERRALLLQLFDNDVVSNSFDRDWQCHCRCSYSAATRRGSLIIALILLPRTIELISLVVSVLAGTFGDLGSNPS